MIKAKILKHKTKAGYHGIIMDGVMHRTGPSVVPQLFPDYADINWIKKSIKSTSEFARSIDDFELVNVTVTEEE